MSYSAWSWKDVEYRLLEAAETLMLLPKAPGPKVFGNTWPSVAKDWAAYGSEPSRYHRRPDRDAIARMDATWEWVNGQLSEPDRKFVYAWARTKVARGSRLADYAEKTGMNDRTMRRRVTRIFKQIAGNLNRLHTIRPVMPVDHVSGIAHISRQKPVACMARANHWRADDAKPRHIQATS